MVFADQVFHIHGPPTHLLSVDVANQRLPADRIFLAHAASLRQTSFFARWKFRGFLHAFNPHARCARLSGSLQEISLQLNSKDKLPAFDNQFGM